MERNKLHELKDEYGKSCGALDWHDHINGMSAKDVDEEMSCFCVYLQKIIISNIHKWGEDNQKIFIYE